MSPRVNKNSMLHTHTHMELGEIVYLRYLGMDLQFNYELFAKLIKLRKFLITNYLFTIGNHEHLVNELC